MVEAYRSSGPLTSVEVVDVWIKWCEDNGLPPPEIDLTPPFRPIEGRYIPE